VNRLCLAANVPLIEGGSTGYLGQVCVHAVALGYVFWVGLVRRSYHSTRNHAAASECVVLRSPELYALQAYVIRKGITECYDCTPKSGSKVYAICTIRRRVRALGAAAYDARRGISKLPPRCVC
jgi:hypothetical protein